MTGNKPLGLFEAYGIELEYMIVDANSLDVKPCADQLLQLVGGGYDVEVERGAALWSNELALHVIEMKTNGPARELHNLAPMFSQQVADILDLLSPLGAKLLPTGMHPWMDPERELQLWPHENAEIYAAFDHIFGCRGHGWANLQSMHINLPFADATEFGRLHAAIRLVLPLIPGLAASTPLVEGRFSGMVDTRLDVYRQNSARVPSVTGSVVPEAVFTPDEYQQQILARIYADLAVLDPEGVLAHEWVNARGAIARFERMAIEIRTIDLQECPSADLAVAELIVETLRALVLEGTVAYADQQRFDTELLAAYHQKSVEQGGNADWPDAAYLSALGLAGKRRSVAEVWADLIDRVLVRTAATKERDRALEVIVQHGNLSARILRALAGSTERQHLQAVYQRLSTCLAQGRMFEPDAV